MDQYSYRDDDDRDEPDTYWRRRAITLAVGLGLLGLLAWTFAGGGGGKPAATAPNSPPSAVAYNGATASPSVTADPSPAASTSLSAQADPALSGLPSGGASTGSASTGGASTGGASTGGASTGGASTGGASTGGASTGGASTGGASTGGASTGGASTGRDGQKAAGDATASTGAAAAAVPDDGIEPGGRCAPSAIVLSLFTSKTVYQGGEQPEFGVDVVSTASGPCSVDLDAGQLYVVVMSSGRIIWDSADCARGGASSRDTELSRGVPLQRTFSWNRTISLPGCVTLAASALQGTYQAEARTATVSSPARTFKLAR